MQSARKKFIMQHTKLIKVQDANVSIFKSNYKPNFIYISLKYTSHTFGSSKCKVSKKKKIKCMRTKPNKV